LAARGFRAVAPFMRGYPPTSVPPDGDYSIARLGHDALALGARLGAGRFALVGHDWGAMAGYAAASLAPDRIAKLVTMAVPHLRVQRASLAQARRSWYIGLFQLPGLPERVVKRNGHAFLDRLWRAWSPGWSYRTADIDPVKQCLAQPGALAAALGYYRALPRSLAVHAETRRAAFGKISVATLTFAGIDDGCMGVEMFDRQREGFSGSIRTVRLERAGHFMHRERPDAFHAELLEFLGPPARLG
jgi:pimeloyl-ACP methyl ester carboxylesterase